MAIINCPECGKEISDKAEKCVHCGYPLNLQSKEKIHTKELLERYYNSVAGSSQANTRTLIDKTELYAYEQKIGKELIDMDADDLVGLILELKNKRNGKKIDYLVSHSGLDQIKTALKNIFSYYCDNYELIRNPMDDKRLAAGRTAFSWEIVDDIIHKIHRDCEGDKADYLELILLLFYNGFARAEEIVQLQPEMIDHRNKVVRFPDRIIYLSDRCYNLLLKFSEMDEIEGWRGNFALSGWNGGYFKFIVRPNKVSAINNRPMTSMCDIINRYIANEINNKYDTKINYQGLYLLGYYDYIVSRFGKEKTLKLITSYRNSDDVRELMQTAKEYGINIDNVSHLKRYLRPFISVDADE